MERVVCVQAKQECCIGSFLVCGDINAHMDVHYVLLFGACTDCKACHARPDHAIGIQMRRQLHPIKSPVEKEVRQSGVKIHPHCAGEEEAGRGSIGFEETQVGLAYRVCFCLAICCILLLSLASVGLPIRDAGTRRKVSIQSPDCWRPLAKTAIDFDSSRVPTSIHALLCQWNPFLGRNGNGGYLDCLVPGLWSALIEKQPTHSIASRREQMHMATLGY
ncbi:hypothetical protein BD289DRAFT_506714 [Coniella lustricola]|uniref:Uncharacterized protein n=1 Tax=Coniella lustricola TaxID=2025994 RepID=A0A2T3A5J1_9PEZI|nr:hypothetical protein BD289DRAFT_506714 [Coniella lustricola]